MADGEGWTDCTPLQDAETDERKEKLVNRTTCAVTAVKERQSTLCIDRQPGAISHHVQLAGHSRSWHGRPSHQSTPSPRPKPENPLGSRPESISETSQLTGQRTYSRLSQHQHRGPRCVGALHEADTYHIARLMATEAPITPRSRT